MWKARGLRFPNMRESRSRGLGIFLIRHFHRFLVTAELCPFFRNLQNFRQVDSNERCCSSESSWSRMGPPSWIMLKTRVFTGTFLKAGVSWRSRIISPPQKPEVVHVFANGCMLELLAPPSITLQSSGCTPLPPGPESRCESSVAEVGHSTLRATGSLQK